MSSTIDWSFFSLSDPLLGMEKACSFSLDDMSALPDFDYTSLPDSPMAPFFDTPMFSSTMPQPCKPFADTWTTPASMLTGPLGVPESDFENASLNSPAETADVNHVFAQDLPPTPSLKRSFDSSTSESSSENDDGGDDDDYNDAPAAKRLKRCRGRPQSVRTSSTSSSSSLSSSSASSKTRQQRVPHNQIERKYREGLNAQFEQLRHAVPTLCQVNDGDRGKPSKATVLISAIAYIKSIERERDELNLEVESRRRRMSDEIASVEDWS